MIDRTGFFGAKCALGRAFLGLGACLLVCCSVVAPVRAQSPKDFFDDNFARQPSEVKDNKADQDGEDQSKETGEVLKQKTDQRGSPFSADAKKTVPEVISKTVDHGKKVLSIGLIVNAVDLAHFQKSVSRVLEVARDRNIPLGMVYLFADVMNFKPEDYVGPLVGQGGDITFKVSVPKKYSEVKMSPTYILETEEGEIVLEAVASLGKYINKRGEYVSPMLPEVMEGLETREKEELVPMFSEEKQDFKNEEAKSPKAIMEKQEEKTRF